MDTFLLLSYISTYSLAIVNLLIVYMCFYSNQRKVYMYLAYGILYYACMTNYIMKSFFTTNSNKIFLRPEGYVLCDIGKETNPIGMPSGHSMTTGFIIGFLYHYLNKEEYNNVLYICLLIAFSRYLCKCHSILQIFLGLTIGILFSTIFHSILTKKENYKIINVIFHGILFFISTISTSNMKKLYSCISILNILIIM